MMLEPASYSSLPTLPMADRMRPGSPLNQLTTLFHVFCANWAALEKNAPILPGNDWKNPMMLLAHEPTKLVNLLQIFRPASVWVKK